MRAYAACISSLDLPYAQAEKITCDLFMGVAIYSKITEVPLNVLLERVGGIGSLTRTGLSTLEKKDSLEESFKKMSKASMKRGTDMRRMTQKE